MRTLSKLPINNRDDWDEDLQLYLINETRMRMMEGVERAYVVEQADEGYWV